jgi:ligand-binding sensor domain-containing protein
LPDFPYVFALAVSGSNLFAGTDGGVFLSTNNGASWTAVNTGLTNTGVLSLAVNGSNLFAGTFGGGVFRSTNNGASWTAVNTGLGNRSIYALAVNGSNLFAGTHSGVFLSANNGTSWATVNTGLPNTEVYSLFVNGSNLFAGTDGSGMFLSTNNGTSWTAVNAGLTNAIVGSFAVSGSNLFTATDRGGVWRRPLSEMVTAVGDDFSQVPVGFELEQNYPNPFSNGATSRAPSAGNPATTIRYQLPKTTEVVLKIYNIFGQEVRTLVNARQPAGVNSVVWDGRDQSGKEMSSGIYIYRLQAGEFTQSRKLSFVR